MWSEKVKWTTCTNLAALQCLITFLSENCNVQIQAQFLLNHQQAIEHYKLQQDSELWIVLALGLFCTILLFLFIGVFFFLFIMLSIEYSFCKPLVLLLVRISMFRFGTYDNNTILTLVVSIQFQFKATHNIWKSAGLTLQYTFSSTWRSSLYAYIPRVKFEPTTFWTEVKALSVSHSWHLSKTNAHPVCKVARTIFIRIHFLS